MSARQIWRQRLFSLDLHSRFQPLEGPGRSSFMPLGERSGSGFGIARTWIEFVPWHAHRGSRVQGQRLTTLVDTTMSSESFPSEILDLVVDDLRGELGTLETCCVVSKSWVPRARKHLFAFVKFHASECPVEWWKKAFPDPSNSPAHHTRTPSISNMSFNTTTLGDLINTFPNIVRLQLSDLSLAFPAPFHELLPTVRSLELSYTSLEAFYLIYSFPLLENLSLNALFPRSDTDGWNPPLTSPTFTGSLILRAGEGTHSVIRRLLVLPDGLHFSEITIASAKPSDCCGAVPAKKIT